MFQYGVLDRKNPCTIIDFSIGLLLAILLLSLPFFIIGFYLYNLDKLEDEQFEIRFGTVLEGLDKKKSSIFYAAWFVWRRFAFVLISIYLFNYIYIQLPLLLVLTLFDAAFMQIYSPYEDKFDEKIETLIEVTTIVLIDICYCFTDLWPNLTYQYRMCYAFIFVIFVCISIQLFFLFRNIFS